MDYGSYFVYPTTKLSGSETLGVTYHVVKNIHSVINHAFVGHDGNMLKKYAKRVLVFFGNSEATSWPKQSLAFVHVVPRFVHKKLRACICQCRGNIGRRRVLHVAALPI